MRAVVPAIVEAVHGATNGVSILLVDIGDTLVAAVGAVGMSLGDQVAELRSTVVSQHRRRPEALLLVPPEFLAAENFAANGARGGRSELGGGGRRPRRRLSFPPPLLLPQPQAAPRVAHRSPSRCRCGP